MQNTSKPVSYAGHTIHFGLDYHKKSWRVYPVHGSVTGKGYTIVNPTAEELSRRLNKTYRGATFVGVYEAGFSGYELARKPLDRSAWLQAAASVFFPSGMISAFGT